MPPAARTKPSGLPQRAPHAAPNHPAAPPHRSLRGSRSQRLRRCPTPEPVDDPTPAPREPYAAEHCAYFLTGEVDLEGEDADGDGVSTGWDHCPNTPADALDSDRGTPLDWAVGTLHNDTTDFLRKHGGKAGSVFTP